MLSIHPLPVMFPHTSSGEQGSPSCFGLGLAVVVVVVIKFFNHSYSENVYKNTPETGFINATPRRTQQAVENKKS